MRRRLKAWAWNLLIAFDQLLNVLAGGYPDETFSSRTYRKALAGQWFWKALRRLIDRVFFWDKDHCKCSYINEYLRGHCPKEWRTE